MSLQQKAAYDSVRSAQRKGLLIRPADYAVVAVTVLCALIAVML